MATVDLSKYGTPEGNAELAQTLIDAIRTKGFFYVKNFEISQEAVDRQFALGQRFYELPIEEKSKYVPNLDAGEYNGYRPAGRRILGGGIPDKTEVWNMASRSRISNYDSQIKLIITCSEQRTHHPACPGVVER